jgi:hypothetical protein
LADYVTQYPDRNTSMPKAYESGAYCMAEIAEFFGVHYMSVNLGVKAVLGSCRERCWNVGPDHVGFRIDVPAPRDLNLHMLSGKQAGANPIWIPGGRLPTGLLEGVINQVPKGQYVEGPLWR